jgi:Kef-type K+ transport system membrane component KefB
MGGDSAFMSMLRITGFLAAAWAAGKVSKVIVVGGSPLSSIVLEITVGVVLGPEVGSLIPRHYSECEADRYTDCAEPPDFDGGYGFVTDDLRYGLDAGFCDLADYAPGDRRLAGGGDYGSLGECLKSECEAHRSSECQLFPDMFTLVGHTGVAMMIFESGMHFDFKMARQVGPWACVVATLGTFLPLVTGMLLSRAYGFSWNSGLAAGTALAPTSVGISLRLLGEAGVLGQAFGQTIMTAAFVDDILSLIIFNIVFAIATGDVTFMSTFFPSLMGVLFMVVAVILAMTFWPWALKTYLLPGAEWLKGKIDPPDPENPPKISDKDQALFIIMLAMLVVYALITFLCGTHLWGCFIAGMSYACLDEEPGHAHHVWTKQTKRITSWMIRIFFSCTVAFSIPVSELLSFEAFLLGSLMGIGPCILTKVLCAFFMGPPRFVIGWAMVGRAEFAYLIAQMAKAAGMIEDKLFSQLIWALLWATIFAPLIFRYVLNKYIRDNGIEVSGRSAKALPPAPALLVTGKLNPSPDKGEGRGAEFADSVDAGIEAGMCGVPSAVSGVTASAGGNTIASAAEGPWAWQQQQPSQQQLSGNTHDTRPHEEKASPSRSSSDPVRSMGGASPRPRVLSL